MFERAKAHVAQLEARAAALEAALADKNARIAALTRPLVVVTGPRRAEAAQAILQKLGVASAAREGEPVAVALSNKYYDAAVGVLVAHEGAHASAQALVVACSAGDAPPLDAHEATEARVCWCMDGEPSQEWRLACLDAQFECLEPGDDPAGADRIAQVLSAVMWRSMQRKPAAPDAPATDAPKPRSAEKEFARNEALDGLIARVRVTAAQALQLPDEERRTKAAAMAMDLLAALGSSDDDESS